MSTDPTLPKEPIDAADLLATLVIKDQDETVCRYPTCNNPRRAETGTGRPSTYCSDSDHTAVSNHRARAALKAIAAGVAQESGVKREQQPPIGVIPVESLRSSVVNGMMQLQGNLERYITTLVEISDPDVSMAQMQATLDRADTRIAEALQNASTERSLRLAADAATVAARQEAQAEREAAELAIEHMEEAEARTKRISEETEQQIAAVQAERDETIERVRGEARQQIDETLQQAKEAVAIAEAATATAQEEARLADRRAHDTEVDARTRIAVAEQLVREANATLERERKEVDRLRGEAVATRTQVDAERAEARITLERERTEARSVLERERANIGRERAEVDRLRGELADTRSHIEQVTIRADQFAALTDELRVQLVQAQAQTTEREQPKQ